MEGQAELLLDDLDRNIGRVDGDRKRSRRAASASRVITILLSALITVLLGSKGELMPWVANAFSVVALVASTALTSTTAWESFADYRGRWVRKRITLGSLMNVRDDLNFALATDKPLDPDRLTEFRDRYNRCLAEEHRLWVAERSKVISAQPSGSATG